MMSRLFKTMNRLPSIFLLLASICLPSLAQTVDTAIVGTVTDNTGAVISGAKVTVTSVATGIAKTAVTAATGEFTVDYLLPGSYNISVTANGFTTTQRQGIEVQLSQQARVNFQLQVGATSEQVTVEAAPPLLQTEASSLGTVVGAEETQNLPLNGRKFEDLAILTPGTTAYDPDNHTSSEDGASVQSYSEQLEWGQTNIDGVTMIGDRHAYVNLYPSTDAIQEFEVISADAEAQNVGAAGDITNIEIKSGTNQVHGDAFDYFRNTALDARNYFLPAPTPKAVYRQHQWGGVVGGPIIKNRTFYFLSYEGINSNEQSAGLSLVLTPAERTGDFSDILNGTALLPPTQLVSPCTGQPYANNKLPATNTTNTGCQDKLDTVAQNIVNKYMPLPNTNQGGFNYAYYTGGTQVTKQFLMRLDHHLNANDSLALHFAYASRTNSISEGNPYFKDNATMPIFNSGLQYVHVVSPTLVNELRLGIDFEDQKLFTTYANTSFTAASIGINGFVQPGPTGALNGAPWPPPEEGFPVIASNELIDIGSSYGIGLDQGKTYQAIDNVTWTHGTHTVIFGADMRHVQDNADTSNTPYGVISFNGSETANNGSSALATEGGFDGADLMIGALSNVITPEGDPLTNAHQWRMFWYIQHNWKVNHNLTVNTGLNYSLYPAPTDSLNTSETMNWNLNPIALVPLDNYNPIWHITGKDFGPRIGFAYSLPRQIVVRGGYGISYYAGQFDNINILQLNPPDDPSFTQFNGNCGYCTNPSPPVNTLENPIVLGAGVAPFNIVSLPPGMRHPDLYLQTWNMTGSKQFKNNVIDVSYVGVVGRKEDTSLLNWNVGPPQNVNSPTAVSPQQDRPNPQFAQMRVTDTNGASIYEGLLFHFEHRLSHGLTVTASYALSSYRDDIGGGTNQQRSQTQIATAKVWANGLNKQKNNLTLAVIYNLPKLNNGNAVLQHAVNGWQIDSIYQYYSGSPQFIYQGADGEDNGNNFEYPDLVPNQPNASPHKSINEWFNTARFTEAIGHYGNAPRNPSWITSPSNQPFQFEINRSFAMPYSEQQKLSLQIQAFNVLNHPQFGAPNGNQSSGSFGTISNTNLDNREVQLVAKYFF